HLASIAYYLSTPLWSYSRPYRVPLVFYCCVDLRDLHSFPTRRSSDLGEVRGVGGLDAARRAWMKGPSRRGRRVPGCVPTVEDHRSEEHTSELQSHLNLVCRLLLEKKQKKNKYIGTIMHSVSTSKERIL